MVVSVAAATLALLRGEQDCPSLHLGNVAAGHVFAALLTWYVFVEHESQCHACGARCMLLAAARVVCGMVEGLLVHASLPKHHKNGVVDDGAVFEMWCF